MNDDKLEEAATRHGRTFGRIVFYGIAIPVYVIVMVAAAHFLWRLGGWAWVNS